MIKRTINFDKFLAEKERDQISITFRGRDYLIYNEIPAFAPIMLARGENIQDKTVNATIMFKAADAIFGKANVDQMCQDGASAQELIQLMQKVFQIINGVTENDEEELSDEDSRKVIGDNKAKK